MSVHKQRRLHLAQLGCLVLQVDPCAESLPELNTDFEGLLVGAHRNPDEVVQGRDHVPALGLHSSHVVLEESSQEQGYLVVKHLPENALGAREVRTSLVDVLWQLLDLLHHALEALDNLRLVLLNPLVQASNLVEASGTVQAILQWIPEVQQQYLDEVGLENESQRDPLKEICKGAEGCRDQGWLHGARALNMALQNVAAKLVNGRKL
mmetsp:Transcript_54504/g.130206  ORF Transcript_54504/g.130206 Transcript_54504/m.130206 type:complete len:208 (-) Transcript_54504:686-1309(-)